MRKHLILVICLTSASCFADQDEIATRQIAGDIGQFALPLTALSFVVAENHSAITNQFAKSVGTTLGVAYSLKFIVNEKRPNGGDHSFPSGHTSAAFAGASFIQRAYGWEYGVPAYAAATFVGWTRVESKAHWVQDVIAGAALGSAVNYYFVEQRHKSPVVFNVLPTLSAKSGIGISATYNW